MDKRELLRLARLGAEERLRRLTDELETIYQHFPELRRPAAQARPPQRARTRRRRMSAAQRKAVSERMKKYWAARRKAKKDKAAA